MRRILLGVLIAACPLIPAQAAIVVVNVTEDLSAVNLSGGGITLNHNLGTTITLAEGDILDLRLDFLGNQTLVASNLTNITAWLFANDNTSIFTSNATLTFNDATGPLVTASDLESNGQAHFGNMLTASQFSSGSGAVSFSGLRLLATVADYADNGSHTYQSSFFTFSGSGFAVGSVPEPSTWAMMLIGFAGMGLTMRRRRGAVSQIA